MANKDIPRHLKHQPIVALDYEQIDQQAGGGDAKFASIGKAQWGFDDFSAKILRKTWDDQRWSRQNEELPLWRVLDLAILVAAQILDKPSGYGESALSDADAAELKAYLDARQLIYGPRIDRLRELLK